VAAIWKSVDGRHLEMSGNVDSVIFMSGLVENVGVEIEIASLSQAVQKLLPLPFFRAAVLDFRWKETSDFPGDGTIENPVPENGGGVVNNGFVYLAGRWTKLEGCKVVPSPPPLFALQNRSLCRGLSFNRPFGLIRRNLLLPEHDAQTRRPNQINCNFPNLLFPHSVE